MAGLANQCYGEPRVGELSRSDGNTAGMSVICPELSGQLIYG